MLAPRLEARHSAVTKLAPASRSRRARSRGQALVEFALILPVFLLMTIGIIDAARMFNAYVTLNNGTTEAAIFAGTTKGYLKVCPTGTTLCPPPNLSPAWIDCSVDYDNVVCHLIGDSSFLDLTQTTVDAPSCAAGCVTGDTVSITAHYHFTPLLPVALLSVWSNGITLTASTKVTVLP